MGILWHYLPKKYLTSLALSIGTFITILFVSRLEEIARFAALGAKWSYLCSFTFYQIPYVLPIALPISCLISSMLLFQRLSHTYECTALRSSGFSLRQILSPILCTSLILSALNFYTTSELATSSHLHTRKMLYELSSVNPLVLLQTSKAAQLQQAFVQMDPIRNGEIAQNLLIALYNPSGKRLNLCLAEQLTVNTGILTGHQVHLISSSPSPQPFDHLMIEYQESMTTPAPEFANLLLRKAGWKMANDHLTYSLLRIRLHQLQREREEGKNVSKNIRKCYSEMIRRFSWGISATTFTLLGCAFGIQVGRKKRGRNILYVLLLSASSLISFCLGKEWDSTLLLSALFFLLPHIGIGGASLWTLYRIQQGDE